MAHPDGLSQPAYALSPPTGCYEGQMDGKDKGGAKNRRKEEKWKRGRTEKQEDIGKRVHALYGGG